MLVIYSPIHAKDQCKLAPSAITESVTVKWVYDGDTLLVTDQGKKNKRKIRLIGIDTPEVKHHQQKAQMYGAKAREELRVLLKQHKYQVLLEFDTERHDRYKRELAHVYLPNGQSISEWLLRRGYAKTLIIPPNVKHAHCYKKIERVAQQQKLNLWKLKKHRLTPVSSLKKRTKGYVRLSGIVSSVRKTKKTIVLELKSQQKKKIQLKIHQKNLQYFKDIHFEKLVNKYIQVSGILKNKKRKRILTLTHSSQLAFVPKTQNSKTTVLPTIKWSLEK